MLKVGAYIQWGRGSVVISWYTYEFRSQDQADARSVVQPWTPHGIVSL